MSVAHIWKLQENTAALCSKISQNVGRTYQEASGEHCGTVQNDCETLRTICIEAARQFTSLGRTLTKAFEKLRDAGLTVPLTPLPLPYPIPPHFRSHEHYLYHQIQEHDTERCSALHHAIQDLIDSGLVYLAGQV
ncbi:hypothetical protein CK203_093802 [Vitis vinifera]|uniref:Uncharacterized protein n=1 Tax=Vitis vinifera TaxID=29760 RepID=A0A438C7P8_VITVI|nr:hypothetical protein CK203_093802 [Vitis vinifera]